MTLISKSYIGSAEVEKIYLGSSVVYEVVSDPVEILLTGTAFGTLMYSSIYDYSKAFDGDISNFYASRDESGVKYIGIDLGSGNEAILSSARIYPRTSFTSRIYNLQLQGSNVSTSIGFVDIGNSTSTSPISGQWYDITGISDTTAYRYYRFLCTVDSQSVNMAEIEFYTE